MNDLQNRSITAFLWGTWGTAFRIGIQVVSQIVLARLLGPEQFGLFATGLVVILFAYLFADGGLPYGLVQRREVTELDVRLVLTWQVGIASLIAVLLFASAPLVAGFFEDDRLTTVVQCLSAVTIITALGGTSSALLRRQMDFRTINIASVVSYAIAFVAVSLPLALLGYGVLAMVLGFIVQASIASAIVIWRVRHSWRPLLWHSEAPELLTFGGTVFITNVLNWVLSSLDRAIVSSSLGVAAVGLYATMSNIINTPAQSALSVLQPVFYSASSKVQGEVEKQRFGLRAMMGGVALFIAPVFAAIAVVGETAVLALFGDRWAGGGEILAPLSLAVPAILAMGLSTPVLWTAGFPRREFQIQLPMAFLFVVVCAGAAKWGSLASVGWAVCLMYYVRAFAIIRATYSAVGMRLSELPVLIGPGLAVGASVATTAFIVDDVLARAGLAPGLRLLAVVGACAVTMLLGSAAVRIDLPRPLLELCVGTASRLPHSLMRKTVFRILGT